MVKKLAAGTIVLLLAVMLGVIFLEQPITQTTSVFQDDQSYGSYKGKEIPYQVFNFFYQNCSNELQGQNTPEIRKMLLPYCMENRVQQVLIGADLAAEVGMAASQDQAKQNAVQEAKNLFDQQNQQQNTLEEDRLDFADWYRRVIQYSPISFRATQLSAGNFFRLFSEDLPESPVATDHQRRAKQGQIRVDIVAFNRQILETELSKTIASPESRQKKIEAIFQQVQNLDLDAKKTTLQDISRITGLTIHRGKSMPLSELSNVQTAYGNFNLLQPRFIARFRNLQKLEGMQIMGPIEIESSEPEGGGPSSKTLFLALRSLNIPAQRKFPQTKKAAGDGSAKPASVGGASGGATTAADAGGAASSDMQDIFLRMIMERQALRGNFDLKLPEFN